MVSHEADLEQRRIDLDAPVQKYVPSFPEKASRITARLLAGHLAGIRHYTDDEFLSAKHYDSIVTGSGYSRMIRSSCRRA